MKKFVSILVALLLVVSSCCAFSEGLMAGGWTICEDGIMTEDAQAAFDKAIGDTSDFAEIKAVRLLGTQVVAGINYSILALSKYDGNGFYSVLTIYEDLEGNAVVNFEDYIPLGIPAENTEEDGQNPVMNFIGNYQDSNSQRARLTISCVGADQALLEMEWPNSAADGVKWTFTCAFDPDTGVFTYTEGVRKPYTADENGNITYGEIEQDLNGTFTVAEDGTIRWNPEGEDADNGCVFEFVYPE